MLEAKTVIKRVEKSINLLNDAYSNLLARAERLRINTFTKGVTLPTNREESDAEILTY